MNWTHFSRLMLRLVWQLAGGDLHGLTAVEGEGLNTLIVLIGNIYAVMFAFVIYVQLAQ